MSFKEKSTWLSLVITLIVWGNYALDLIAMHVSDADISVKRESALWLINSAIIYVIILETVLHSVLAMAHPNSDEQKGDERDHAFGAKSANIAYTVLFTGVIIGIGHFMLIEQFPRFEQSSLAIPFIGIHILVFAALIAEITRFVSLLMHYRRGY